MSIVLHDFFHVNLKQERGLHELTLVDKIRALAKQHDMSLPQLEIELGLGNGTISRWKTSSPNTDKLLKIAKFFHVSREETSSVIEKFNVKIAVVHFPIDINRESEAKKESVERMKMRENSPPTR